MTVLCALFGHRPAGDRFGGSHGLVGPCERRGCDHVTWRYTNGPIGINYVDPDAVSPEPVSFPGPVERPGGSRVSVEYANYLGSCLSASRARYEGMKEVLAAETARADAEAERADRAEAELRVAS